MGRIIGIDLGTTNSCVTVLEGAAPVVIPNDVGGRTTPSIVAFTKDGSVLVGASAKRQAVANPENTLFGVKRLIGRQASSPAVKGLKATMPYSIVASPNGDAAIEAGGKTLSPPEVSAHVLRQMKQIAEDYLGEEVTDAVVTVPAYFDDAQRNATKDAGKIAGLDVKSVINEPTAAALAYGVQKRTDSGIVAVFDLGGGTFDVSILRIEGGVFEVLSTSGDTALGGDDFDRVIVSALMTDFQAESGIDVSRDPAALQRLKEAAEHAKHDLSGVTETDINLPFLGVGARGPAHLNRTVERAWFDALTLPLVERLTAPCERAISDARITKADVSEVVLVGGMTRVPAVEQKVVEIFGKKPVKGINPDEIVALGAATQSGLMMGTLDEVMLLDVTSQSFGIRVVNDRMSVVIPRNTTIPTRAEKVFRTTEKDQDRVTLDVFQGEEPTVGGNRLIGSFALGGLPLGAAGSVQVKVSFTIDTDGILAVDAIETRSGQKTSLKISASSGLARGEVDRLSAEFSAARV